jgi:hypothetical protein
MKKLNLWLFASLFLAAFTLCACGGDDGDGDTPPPTPTSVVGTWDAFIKASNPDDMALRYSHKLTYVFNQDGTFKIRTIYGQGESSEQFQGEETVVFTGKYVANNGKLQFRNITYVMIMWDNTRERGSMDDLTLNYSLSGNTLTIASDDPNMVRFGHHHILVSTLTKSSGDIDDDKTPEITEAKLKGIWDGSLEHDFAQGYYQRWRIQFDGKNYTSWHTHLTAGSTKDDVQGVKTVGNKEQGTWEYVDGALVLTPKKMWASYYFAMTSIQTGDGKYVYYNYNPETMEADEWYETPEDLVKAGVEQDLNASNPIAYMYIKSWPVVGFADTELSIKINMDVFKLDKQ